MLSIPLIDYALLVKGSVGRPLDDQEFLDRQDKYDLVFFLDEGGRWMNSYIYINSWKIVVQHGGLLNDTSIIQATPVPSPARALLF